MRCCCANNLLPGVNYVRASLSNCRRANLWRQGENFRRPAAVGDQGPRRPRPLVPCSPATSGRMIEICLEPMKSGLLCGGPEHQAVALYEWLQ